MTTHKDNKDRDAHREVPREEQNDEKKEATVQERLTGEPATPPGEQPPSLQGKPTPTQEEQDAFARGDRNVQHEPTGAPETTHGQPVDHRLGRKTPEEEELERQGFKRVHKESEPERGAPYKTRQHVAEKKKED